MGVVRASSRSTEYLLRLDPDLILASTGNEAIIDIELPLLYRYNSAQRLDSSFCYSTMRSCSLAVLALLSVTSSHVCEAFVPAKGFGLNARSSSSSSFTPQQSQLEQPSYTSSPARPVSCLFMGLDLVTYLRTEWISAALVSNQTPRSADVCLELGTQDGRAVSYIPKTVREFITSSAEPDGKLTVTTRRQVKLQQQRRDAATGIAVKYMDQAADDLSEQKDESVDVVFSLQCAARLLENGRDWKRSVREAARVLKPGGRFLFVEQTMLDNKSGEEESYLEYVQLLLATTEEDRNHAEEEGTGFVEADPDALETRLPVFSEVGFDNIDLVLQAHVAGMAVKSMDAGLSPSERAQKVSREKKDRATELGLIAYERGNKKRKRKKKDEVEADGASSPKA